MSLEAYVFNFERVEKGPDMRRVLLVTGGSVTGGFVFAGINTEV